MSLQSVFRQLVAGSNAQLLKTSVTSFAGPASHAVRSYASDTSLSRKDVVYLLNSTADPEVEQGIASYLRGLYQSAGSGKAAAEATEEALELTSRIEKKYVAAQIVESGIQNVSVPLSWEAEGSSTSIKRFVSELLKIGSKAGFESPAVEIEKKLSESASTAETVKELLAKIKPYTSADFHAGLVEAVQEVENEIGSSVVMSGSTQGYKKFAAKVKALATAHNLPVDLLVKVKAGSADPAVKAQLSQDFSAWLESALVTDAKTEISALQGEAARLLDGHLSKTAEQVRKEQEAVLASTLKRIEGAKGAVWAQKLGEDLKALSWFDEVVAANPKAGPVAA